MTKENFEKYATLKKTIKDSEAQLEELNGLIVKEMNEQEIDKIESDFGSFYFTVRKTYSYSDNIEKMNTELKDAKKKEEESGTATAKETKSLTYRQKTN